MNKFIYCFDEELKNKFISKGFKILHQIIVDNQQGWVFASSPELDKYMVFNKNNKIYYSNRLNF